MSRRRRNLARQITAAMMAVAIARLALMTTIFYAVYWGGRRLFPALGVPDVPLIPTHIDMAILLGSAAAALILSSLVAVKLATRIARPLQSVARSAQRIAKGDLSVRVVPDDDAPAEAATLIADFNAMTERLEAMARRMVTWNAQIAHELRTPITILIGRLQGAIDGVFLPDEKWTTSLLVQVTLLRRLVEDLRVVSLADSGRLDLRPAEVELDSEIAALAELVTPELDAAGLTLSLELASGTVTVDIARVSQALMVLLENARRYADPGDLLMTLTFGRDDLTVEVVDVGPGLPPDFVPYAFDEFARAGLVRRSTPAGSGLGLSVVQAIARAHGGEATYRQAGRGSAFSIRLPRHFTSRG